MLTTSGAQPVELLARLHALARRPRHPAARSHLLAYAGEAKLNGSPMESHVEAQGKERRRNNENVRSMQDNFNRRGFSKNAKILKRQTNANTKRTDENNLQILKQSAKIDPETTTSSAKLRSRMP